MLNDLKNNIEQVLIDPEKVKISKNQKGITQRLQAY